MMCVRNYILNNLGTIHNSVGSVLIYLGLILTSGISSTSTTKEGGTINGGVLGLISGNQFSVKEELPFPEKELKFTFILVKHGMAVPKFPGPHTYPSDNNYKDKWEPDTATMRGRCLMFMVGRSLKTRYRKFFGKITSNQIMFSSITKDYAVRLTADLGYGLFGKTDHGKQLGIDLSWVLTNRNFEKTDKLTPLPQAQCNWMKILLEKLGSEINGGPLIHLTRCTQNLYETLKNHIIVMDEEYREWIMDSPERVYNLWTLLVFEVIQGQKEPEWAKNQWSRIQSCVFEYHKTLLDFHPAVPAMILGRMIKQMEDEVNGNAVKFHVHVTNDIGAVSMNWTLPGFLDIRRSYWPDPGDALMFDFFTDNTLRVSSFSGWQRSFDKVYEGSQEEFFLEYKNKKIYLTQEEWKNLCSYDGRSEMPKEMDGKLFAQPTHLSQPSRKLSSSFK